MSFIDSNIHASVLLIFLSSLGKQQNAQRSKEEGIDQESIQSDTTPDPGHHIGN